MGCIVRLEHQAFLQGGTKAFSQPPLAPEASISHVPAAGLKEFERVRCEGSPTNTELDETEKRQTRGLLLEPVQLELGFRFGFRIAFRDP